MRLGCVGWGWTDTGSAISSAGFECRGRRGEYTTGYAIAQRTPCVGGCGEKKGEESEEEVEDIEMLMLGAEEQPSAMSFV